MSTAYYQGSTAAGRLRDPGNADPAGQSLVRDGCGHEGVGMRIVVCGGGIGGLVLAQSLRRIADVTVLERDRRPTDTGGYRLHLDGPACAALRRSLDAELFDDIRAVSDPPSTFTQFTIATRDLDPMVIDHQDPAEDRLLVQRQALRLLLTRGIEDQVQWDVPVAAVTPADDGARVRLADGRRLSADLVVGADGAQSPSVAAVTGASASRDLGVVGIA